MRYPIFLLIAIILCIPLLAQSACAAEITLKKQSYLPGETLQANISGEFLDSIAVNNIFFVNSAGKEVGLAFYMLKISDKEYWVYVDLPEQAGNYTFAVKNVLYKEDGVLKGNPKEIPFDIKQTISYFYKDIIEKTTGKFSSLNTEGNALALLSLGYNTALASQAKSALMSKKLTNNCWNPSSVPSLPCTIKDTALALFALKDTGIDTSWFIDAQNNLDVGLWNLVVDSPIAQQCDVYTNSGRKSANLTGGENVISLDLKNKDDEVIIKINCSVASAKIVHTYLGKINEFQMSKQDNSSAITLNNQKCFGQSYRSDCDAESTAYALLALDACKLDEADALNWLKANAATTKQKAIALYFGDNSEKEFLLNNQDSQGYWTKKSLIESNEADIESTVFAVWALEKAKENNAASNGKKWLRETIYGNLTNEILAAVFVFPSSQIESILSVNPAIIKTKVNSLLSITVKNKGITDLSVSANFIPFNTKKDLSLQSGKDAKIDFSVPNEIGNKEIKENVSGSIEISYSKFSSGSYSIPVLVIADKNATPGFVIEVPKGHFRFLEQEVNITMLTKENTLIPLTIKNLAQNSVKDISISYSRDLKDIINITPSYIKEIDAGSESTIDLRIESAKTGNFTGFIEASSNELSAVLPINITFTKNESKVTAINITTQENKTCNDYNGTVCKKGESCEGTSRVLKEGKCCIGKCKSRRNLQLLGFAMILIAVLVIALFIMSKMKKPKKDKEMKEVLEKIEKKYDKYSGKPQLPV